MNNEEGNKMLKQDMQIQKNTRKAAKGIKYPMFDLEDAVLVAKNVSNLGGGEIDFAVLAQGLNYSLTTARHHTNSAKYFNLISQEKDIISNTDLANRICIPISDEEMIQNRQIAFLNFPIFRTLYERFRGNTVPDEKILSNLLHREFGVSVRGKDVLSRNFLSSLKYSQLGKEVDNKITIPSEESDNDFKNIEEKSGETTTSDVTQNVPEPEMESSMRTNDILDIDSELETYKSKGLFLQVDSNNYFAIKKGILFLKMLLAEDED